MGRIHRFPDRPPGKIAAGLAPDLARAVDLLHAVRAATPPNPRHCDAEQELEVFGRAVRNLQAVRPLEDTPDAESIALTDEALVLADLCGQALHLLEPRRLARALPIVLQGLLDAVQSGPEAAPLNPELPRA